jgi:peroxiredoxin Q/BCP
MKINDLAPDFTTQDENGKTVTLAGWRGHDVLLYFYPKANTPGCTIEACGFRDVYGKLQAAGLVVLGISADTPSAQKKFKEKYELPFPLLADAKKEIAELYGVVKEKTMYGKKCRGIVRTTFLIAPDGHIRHIFPEVKPQGHAEEVLALVTEK